MRPGTSVVIRDDRIVEVGPAASVAVPAGATVIDATGKTVMPGMWEMHTHLQLTNQSAGSLVQLAQGLTTVRDLAADFDIATSQRDRERQGLLASPRVVLAGFIEGPGRWAGPTDVIAKTEDEALAYIARYDSAGYKQIKLYNLVQQDLVPAIAAEAHRRGMRLSGHIPRGLSVPAAVLLGYDEIQHAAFLFSTFFQDSLYVPTMRAYSAVATAVAPNFDVDGVQMSELIKFLHDHGTVIDGTFNIWIGGGAAMVGAGGSTNQQKADAAYLRLIRRLYDGGVTLVAGTDNSYGNTYHREIELYEQAGIPAPRVLQIATIVSARVMKEDKDYGSIAAGKVADIIIVNGKPAQQVKDIEKVETVIRAGRIYNGAGSPQRRVGPEMRRRDFVEAFGATFAGARARAAPRVRVEGLSLACRARALFRAQRDEGGPRAHARRGARNRVRRRRAALELRQFRPYAGAGARDAPAAWPEGALGAHRARGVAEGLGPEPRDRQAARPPVPDRAEPAGRDERPRSTRGAAGRTASTPRETSRAAPASGSRCTTSPST